MNKWESAAKVLGGSLVAVVGVLVVASILCFAFFGSVPLALSSIWKFLWSTLMPIALCMLLIAAVCLIVAIVIHEWFIKGLQGLMSGFPYLPSNEAT